MAQRHSIPAKAILNLVQQAQCPVDTSRDYRVLINVKGGEVHLTASNQLVSKDPGCVECDRYEALLSRRDDERGVNGI